MFRRLFVNGILPLLVIAVVWTAIVAYWRDGGHIPDIGDMLLCLIGLPAALMAGALLVQKGVTAWARPQLSEAQVAPAVVHGTRDRAEVAIAPLAVLAGALRAPHGSSAAELRQAWEAGEVRPLLDPVLRDRGGFPILSYRVADLDEQVLAGVLAGRGFAPRDEGAWMPGQLRALALGADVVTELASVLVAHFGRNAAGEPYSWQSAPPMLQVIALLPAEWDTAVRQAAGGWFLSLIEQLGWPRERASLNVPALSGPLAPFDAMERLAAAAGETGHAAQPSLALLLACASHIDERTIGQLESTRRLRTVRDDDGEIPGEAAAGLLLADSTLAARLGLKTVPLVHRAIRKLHENSAAARRGDAGLLANLAEEALKAVELDAARISLLACDSDHRASRQAEFLGMGAHAFPDLDAKSRCLATGKAGATAAVGTLLALVLCSDEAAQNARPALCLSNGDGLERAAALVCPASVKDLAQLKV